MLEMGQTAKNSLEHVFSGLPPKTDVDLRVDEFLGGRRRSAVSHKPMKPETFGILPWS